MLVYTIEELEQKKKQLEKRKGLPMDDVNELETLLDSHIQALRKVEEKTQSMIDKHLAEMLNEVYGWAQHIRFNAQRIQADGLDDDGLIIQETVEDYLRQKDIPLDTVVDLARLGLTHRMKRKD